MITLKLVPIGNSLGFVLPKEARLRMRVEKGDNIYLVETSEGYSLTPYDPKFSQTMAAKKVMIEDKKALSSLAEL